MVRSIELGLALSDWDLLTIGMIIDYIIEYENLHSENTVREATQADFDKF